jgi:hypothetical protein
MGVKSRTKKPSKSKSNIRRKSTSKSKSKRGKSTSKSTSKRGKSKRGKSKSKKTNTSKNPQEAFFKKYCDGAFQSKLLEGMNVLISDMNKGTKSEKEFVKKLKQTLPNISFLTFENNKIKLQKEKDQKGGAPNDEEKICKNTGQIVTSMPPSNETNPLSILQQQMNELSTELTSYRLRPDAVQSEVIARQNQLTNMAMAIEAVRQRQQAIDIVRGRENWNRTGDICNSLLSLTFTGLAGYLSYLVVTLFEGAATFITTGVTGIFMLFCISIFQIFISLINGVGTRIPGWMGGGDIVTTNGRDLAYNITSTISRGITETPELNDSLLRLQELGYTTKMIAFMILFVMFMIITHIIRIFMTARRFSIGWTGVSVGDGRQQLQNISTSVQAPQLGNRNIQDQQSNTNLQLTNNEPDINGGYKKKKKTKANKSKKKSKKTKKARKKRR